MFQQSYVVDLLPEVSLKMKSKIKIVILIITFKLFASCLCDENDVPFEIMQLDDNFQTLAPFPDDELELFPVNKQQHFKHQTGKPMSRLSGTVIS